MAKTVSTPIALEALDIGQVTIPIVGDSPLISHAWDAKARKQYLDQLTGKSSIGHQDKHPTLEFINSLYWLTGKPDIDYDTSEEEAGRIVSEAILNAKFGFPTAAFKAASIDAAMRAKVIKKTVARGAFFIRGEFAVINGIPTPREDMVRIAHRAPDIRFRAEFKTWSTSLDVDYNKRIISAEQLINCFRMGGYACGVGDWRPDKGGSFGMFHVGIQ